MFLRQFSHRLIKLAMQYGVIGLGFGTFFESLGIPFASIALPLVAGSLIRSGRTTFPVALLVSTTGLVLGSIASYYIGYFGGEAARRSLKRPSSRLLQWFANSLDRYGLYVITVAQLYGPARTWISIPAGAARMDIKAFTVGTAIGGTIYCALAISLSVALTRLISDITGFILVFININVLIGATLLLFTLLIIYLLVRREMDKSKTY